MKEIFKQIPGFPSYEVSNLGQVKSLKNGKSEILKNGKRRNGYVNIALCENKVKKYIDVHRLVLISFVGMPGPGMECDHVNRVRDDNRIENLRWVNKRENIYNSNRKIEKPFEEEHFHGVKKNKGRNKKYRVQFKENGKNVHYGTFYTFEEAKQQAMKIKHA